MQPFKTLATALAVSSALTASAYAATKVGVIGAANPQVYVTSTDGTERLLKVGDEIFLNDEVRTNGKGSAQLMFLDKSALTISPGSTITVDKFVYDPAKKDGTMTINGAKGAFRFIGGALTKKRAVKIKTPVSTIGIRGGIGDIHVGAGGETDALFIFGKELTVTNGQGQTSSTTQFGTGLGIQGVNDTPTLLPQNVVETRLNNSPTTAAIRFAPNTNSDQSNTLQNKININTTGDGTAGGGAGGSSNDSGGNSNSGGNAPAGGTNNSGSTGSGGANNNTDDGGTTPVAENDNTGPLGNQNDGGPVAGAENNDGGPVIGGENAPGLEDGPAGSFSEFGTDGEFGGEGPIVGFGDGPAAGNGEGPGTIDVAALGGGNQAAQEELRNDVDQFVQTGGDADGDGRLDFNITDAGPGTGPGGPNDGDGRGFFDQLFGDNQFGPNGGPGEDGPGDRGPNADGEFPVGEGPLGEDPLGEDLRPGDDTLPGNTPPPAGGGGGGGGGGSSLPPVAPRETLTGGMVDETPFMVNGSRFFNTATLLNNATDPDSGINVPNQIVNVTVGDASGTISGGVLTLDFDEDVLPGLNETITIEYDISDGTNVVTRTADIIVQGQDFFGGVNAWANPTAGVSNEAGEVVPELPKAEEISGRLVVDNLDALETKEYGVEAFDGIAADGPRYDGNRVFQAELEYLNGMDLITQGIDFNDPEVFVIGKLPQMTGPGRTDFMYDEVRFEDNFGRVDMSNGFDGFGIQTTAESFAYYQLGWTDDMGTSTPGDDEDYALRGFLATSILDEASGVPDARIKYDLMLADAALAPQAVNGIIEYDFLPNLHEAGDNTITGFGLIDYNRSDQLPSGMFGTGSPYGLFVDWNNKKFLGGDVRFKDAAGDGFIRTLFGKVESGTNAITSMNFGSAFGGTYYAIDQYIDFANSGRSHSPTVDANPFEFGAPDMTAGDPIEGFVVETFDPNTSHFSEQPVVISDGATAGLLDNTLTGTASVRQGYTAGIVMDYNDDVSRIAGNATINLLAVTNNVDANINYSEKDTAGSSFSDGDTHGVNFGTSNGDAQAAIQNDLYAAEADGTGAHNTIAETKGVLVSMHDAVSGQANLVCNSCQFAHWGVWQADHITSSIPDEKTALVPYVAGEMTTDAELAAVAAMTLGTVTYTGDAAANFAVIDNTAINPTEISNAFGTFSANIDLDNRQIMSGQMQINFTDFDGSRDLAIQNNGVLTFGAGNNTFTGGIQTDFTDGNGASTGMTAMGGNAGNISGAFFGPTAEEVGGNFYAQGDTNGLGGSADETVKAGGIYLGARP